MNYGIWETVLIACLTGFVIGVVYFVLSMLLDLKIKPLFKKGRVIRPSQKTQPQEPKPRGRVLRKSLQKRMLEGDSDVINPDSSG